MTIRSLLFAAALAPLAACGGSAGDGIGTLLIEATDAPLLATHAEAAVIGVGKVYLHRESSAESGFVTIYEGPPIEVDLADLRNGIRELMVEAQLPAGSYKQVRLVVDHARLALDNGNRYSTGEGTLELSSHATSGLKIHIRPPIRITSGLSTTLLLDFDMLRSFRPRPEADPLEATSFKVHPVIRAANLSSAGEIRGLVTRDDGSGTRVGVDAAVVHILPPGETDTALAVATTVTESDGTYAVLGLDPGTYDVLAELEALSDREDGRTVAAGNSTVVDLALQ